jgi:uncharacterized membrane protein YbhN (UPF0104 family)
MRALALVVSGVALVLIARRLDRIDLLQQLKQMRPLWFLGALGAFLISVSLSSWRWHQMLKVTGTAINLRTSWRLTLIGHCFSALFFGAAVSDLAKATLYSRWFGFPVPRLLAASVLDRSTGALSTMLYALATLGYGVWAAPRIHWQGVEWVPVGKIALGLGIVLVIIAILALVFRSRWLPALRRFWLEMSKAARALRSRSGVALAAVLVGFLIQVMVSVILGCCLRAVAIAPIPWVELLWTFPVIGLMASVPITISGAGAREGAAILLWTTFGITSATAFSASLLTLSVNLLWAAAGAVLLWRGGADQSSPES